MLTMSSNGCTHKSGLCLSQEQALFVHAAPAVHQSLQSWAGTGKTHTLTERVVHLITEHGVDPSKIVITTFTVEGAKECLTRLNSRLAGQLNNDTSNTRIRVGTMDSLAYGWLRHTFQHYTGVQEYGPLLLEYLRSPEGQPIVSSVEYLVVDEFQDLSQVQLNIVMEFYKGGTTILAIGDVAQNIYEWRGCHGHFLSGMGDRIPDLHQYRLTINRRCTPEIIELGNACLRVLRHPHTSLMMPVRPSIGKQPTLDTLEPMRSMGSHVLRVLRKYHHCHEQEPGGSPSTYGSMAVISRYKQGLFNVEESIIRANRSASSQDAIIPFVTSASIGDGGESQQSRRKDGHLTLMTLHQSKGLEWPTVILLLWDPALSDEEWRLLYVAVTRARDCLHIISPSAAVTKSILNHINEAHFAFPNGFDGVNQRTDAHHQSHRHIKKRLEQRLVSDVVRSLTSEDIREMRERNLIPVSPGAIGPMPGCNMVLKYNSASTDDDVDANGLQAEFGHFVSRWITRLMWSHSSLESSSSELLNLEDRDVMALLNTVMLPKDLFAICQKHYVHVRAFLDGAWTLADVLHAVDGGTDAEDMRVLGQALDRISTHCRMLGMPMASVVLASGRPYMKLQELAKLRAAHDAYTNLSLGAREGMYATYRVSLSTAILKGRRSMWYHPDAYHWCRRKLSMMHRRIQQMVQLLAKTIHGVRPQFHYEPISNKTVSNPVVLVGEAAAVLLCPGQTDSNTIVDVRCSMKTNDFAWLLQGLAMVAMGAAQRLIIINPQLQSQWEYDCSQWKEESREAFLSFLQQSATC